MILQQVLDELEAEYGIIEYQQAPLLIRRQWQQFGAFRVVRPLGQGGMGQVYLAVAPNTAASLSICRRLTVKVGGGVIELSLKGWARED